MNKPPVRIYDKPTKQLAAELHAQLRRDGFITFGEAFALSDVPAPSLARLGYSGAVEVRQGVRSMWVHCDQLAEYIERESEIRGRDFRKAIVESGVRLHPIPGRKRGPRRVKRREGVDAFAATPPADAAERLLWSLVERQGAPLAWYRKPSPERRADLIAEIREALGSPLGPLTHRVEQTSVEQTFDVDYSLRDRLFGV